MDSSTSLPDGSGVVHTGGCFCKALTYQVMGKPILSAYCHCTLCQKFNAAAFILTVHFSESNFKWTHPEPQNDAYETYSVSTKPWKIRYRCKNCGCAIASYSSKERKWSVWGGQLDRDGDGKIVGWDTIKPTAHIFYETHMIDIKDDLGKWTGYENISERIDLRTNI